LGRKGGMELTERAAYIPKSFIQGNEFYYGVRCRKNVPQEQRLRDINFLRRYQIPQISAGLAKKGEIRARSKVTA
jgi:hypothetical protein